MKKCCSDNTERGQANVRQKEIGSNRRSRFTLPIVVGLIIVAALFFYSHYTGGNSSPTGVLSIVPEANAAELSFPQDSFSDGKAHYFDYTARDGTKVRYFIMKSSDGVIRAAFDACNVCFRERKGYVQRDDSMVCKNCGRRFQSTKINEVTGGCNPAPLTRSIKDGKVLVRTEDLDQGKTYFDPRGGIQ